jgi:hypothetical protein
MVRSRSPLIFLKHRASPLVKDTNDRTPLDYIKESGYIDLINVLEHKNDLAKVLAQSNINLCSDLDRLGFCDKSRRLGMQRRANRAIDFSDKHVMIFQSIHKLLFLDSISRKLLISVVYLVNRLSLTHFRSVNVRLTDRYISNYYLTTIHTPLYSRAFQGYDVLHCV